MRSGLQVLDAVQTALAPAMPRLAAFQEGPMWQTGTTALTLKAELAQESSTNMFASAAAWAVDSFRTKGKGTVA
eukprot:4519815-Amphidinium_carterae.1